MKNFVITLFICFCPLLLPAQDNPSLSLIDYLSQVRVSNPSLESANLLEQSSSELLDEGNHVYYPSLFSNYSHTYDKKQTMVPTFQGTKTTMDDFAFGINQNTNFGLESSLFYNMDTSHVFGANPAFYPQPKLHIHSLNLQLTQSLLKNGFGRSTRAAVAIKTAQNKSIFHQQKFQTKLLISDAENRYWRLSIARAFIQVQQNSVDRTDAFRKINLKRAKLHLIDNADLLAIDAALKQRELELRNAIDQEKVYARAFNESRGKNSDQVPEQLVFPTPDIIEQLPALTKSNQREDIKAMEAAIDVTKQSAITARDQRLPQLDVFALLSTNGLDPSWNDATSDTFTTDHPMTTVGMRLNVPLDFSKNAKVRRAYSKQVQGAEKNYEQALLQQETSWNTLNQQWTESKERLKLGLELRKIQNTKLEKERQRQQQGRSTTYQVFLFEQDLLNVELLILQTQELAINIYTQMKTYGE